MAMSDITIHGAGIFGLSIAWACLERGARVRVIDPYGPGAGASGGIVGALAPHVPENWNEKKAFQLESLLMAEAFWAVVEAAGGLSAGYARTGRLQPLADAAALELARARGRGAGALWLGLAEWHVAEADMFDWAPASPTGFVIHDTLTARVHPKQACAALVAAIRERGGEVLREGVERGQVIHATGTAGLEALNRDAARQIGMGIKGQAALLEFAAPEWPQLFAGGVHIVPHADGTVAIGSTSERDYASGTETDAQLDDVIAAARTTVPALADAPVVARWAGLRPRTRSRAPMLGAHPLYEGHFIANGGFKIGFGMAPKVAEVMADLVLEGRDSIPEGFRPAASL